MRISELARRSGVPVGTVKHYLREGLLPAGERMSATQAQYGEEHVARIGLIRALLGTGGLSTKAARAVLAAVDDPTSSAHDMIGAAYSAIQPPAATPPDLAAAQAHLRRWGWQVHDDSPPVAVLAQALAALEAAGFDTPRPAVGPIRHGRPRARRGRRGHGADGLAGRGGPLRRHRDPAARAGSPVVAPPRSGGRLGSSPVQPRCSPIASLTHLADDRLTPGHASQRCSEHEDHGRGGKRTHRYQGRRAPEEPGPRRRRVVAVVGRGRPDRRRPGRCARRR